MFPDDHSISISPNKKRKKDNRIKVRKKIKNPSMASLASPNLSQQTTRQRVELKGPRVKHVCRSASVALGQPLATFPPTEGKEDAETPKTVAKVNEKEEEKTSKKEDATKDKDLQKPGHDSTSCNITINTHPPPKRGKAQQNTSSSNLLGVNFIYSTRDFAWNNSLVKVDCLNMYSVFADSILREGITQISAHDIDRLLGTIRSGGSWS